MATDLTIKMKKPKFIGIICRLKVMLPSLTV